MSAGQFGALGWIRPVQKCAGFLLWVLAEHYLYPDFPAQTFQWGKHFKNPTKREFA